jgi:hypothetical protein
VSRSEWVAIGAVPLGFALPLGVKLTTLRLGEGAGSARLWLGLPLMAAGAFGVECLSTECPIGIRTTFRRSHAC